MRSGMGLMMGRHMLQFSGKETWLSWKYGVPPLFYSSLVCDFWSWPHEVCHGVLNVVESVQNETGNCWRSDLLPSWFQLVLFSFSFSHSFLSQCLDTVTQRHMLVPVQGSSWWILSRSLVATLVTIIDLFSQHFPLTAYDTLCSPDQSILVKKKDTSIFF